MLADDVKAVQRKIVKDSFADKMAALKKQEAEFSDLINDLFTLRAMHDKLQEKMSTYRDTYLNKSKARLIEETGVTSVELRYIMSQSASLATQSEEDSDHDDETAVRSDTSQE